MIPAHWRQQVITSQVSEKGKYTPTQARQAARARMGRRCLLHDHAEGEAYRREPGLQDASSFSVLGPGWARGEGPQVRLPQRLLSVLTLLAA